jgi:hypothetical protein
MGINADSPWKEAKLFVNDREIAWGEPVALFRGEESEVRVEVPSSIGGELNLGLVNDDGLTVGADPAFNDWVPGSDGKFTWALTPEAGKSGRVQLVVLSREVDEFWTLPCWVISSSLADEVDEVVVAAYDPQRPPSANDIFFRDEPRYVTVSYKKDSPLRGYPLQLIATPLTGVVPSNLSPNPSQPTTVHAWWMTANANSGTFSLELTGAGMSGGIALPAFKAMSRYLYDEADVLIGGTVVPPEGIDFTIGSSQVVTLKPKPSSPLAGHPVKLKHKLLDLQPADLISDPDFDSFETEHRWSVTGLTGGGRFQLSLEGQGMTRALDVPVCRLSPEQGVDVWYNGFLKEEGRPIALIKEQWADLTFKLKPGTSSSNPIKLEWVGTPHPRVTIDPALPSSKPIDIDIGAIWKTRCLANSEGVFSLRITIEDLLSKEIRFLLSEL